jgi:hypothetical protein
VFERKENKDMIIDNLSVEELKTELKKHLVLIKNDLINRNGFVFNKGEYYNTIQDEGGLAIYSDNYEESADIDSPDEANYYLEPIKI